MSDTDRLRLKKLFAEAVDLQPDEQERFLKNLAAEDPRIHGKLEELLAVTAPDGMFHVELVDPAERKLNFTVSEKLKRIEGYDIEEEIARGGFAVIYRAKTKDQQSCAIKIPNLKMANGQVERDIILNSVRHEGQVLSGLSHENIVSYRGRGEFEDGTPYIVMEHLKDARPITEYADACCLSIDERLKLFAAVCDAVAHAHGNNVKHLDLNPNNILVDFAGRPVLIDFGSAEFRNWALSYRWNDRPQSGISSLTVRYASPEQHLGKEVKEVHSDIFSLGVVLYELLTGRLPRDLQACNDMVRIRAKIQEKHAPDKPSQVVANPLPYSENAESSARKIAMDRGMSSTPQLSRRLRRLDDVVLKALETEPTNRYKGVTDFRSALELKSNRLLPVVGLVGTAAVFLLAIVLFVSRYSGDPRQQAVAAETEAINEKDEARNSQSKFIPNDRFEVVKKLGKDAAEEFAAAAREYTLGRVEMDRDQFQTAYEHFRRARFLFRKSRNKYKLAKQARESFIQLEETNEANEMADESSKSFRNIKIAYTSDEDKRRVAVEKLASFAARKFDAGSKELELGKAALSGREFPIATNHFRKGVSFFKESSAKYNSAVRASVRFTLEKMNKAKELAKESRDSFEKIKITLIIEGKEKAAAAVKEWGNAESNEKKGRWWFEQINFVSASKHFEDALVNYATARKMYQDGAKQQYDRIVKIRISGDTGHQHKECGTFLILIKLGKSKVYQGTWKHKGKHWESNRPFPNPFPVEENLDLVLKGNVENLVVEACLKEVGDKDNVQKNIKWDAKLELCLVLANGTNERFIKYCLDYFRFCTDDQPGDPGERKHCVKLTRKPKS